MPAPLQRIAVIGSSCAGKTTFSRALSHRLGLPHVELDTLHWGPGWTSRPLDVFRADVQAAVAKDRWIVDGNYSRTRDLVWPRADTIVWLDYSFPLVLRRSVSRSLRRAVTRETLFAGNRESLALVFDPEWIPWWVIRTFRRRRREYTALLGRPESSHLVVNHFSTPEEAQRFLESMSVVRPP